ncbi:hypothetical protein E2C01_098104 [Portunus trituberculatus]|uniref:Uncharacterized protein n=1 Tax=Portunus trituberculatus TaxID=210409 RepID=A0A5B7KD58_PORTR|nr:hypothetical protein [Portunus trituberculatus]
MLSGAITTRTFPDAATQQGKACENDIVDSSTGEPVSIWYRVQWNHACFGVREVSKRTGSNPVHGLSVGWASLLGATMAELWCKGLLMT